MGALPYPPFVECGKVRDPPPPPPPYCTLTPPLLHPAPRLCTNGVSAGVTQGQGRRPFYALPLCSPCPLLRPPVRAQTGFVPTQGHYALPLHSPRRLRGRGRYVTPRFGPALY
jgi:hypothetical protein